MWSDWKLGLCVRMRCLRGGVEVLDMHTHVITFAQNDEPVQFYHHRIDLSYLIIEILACLPAGIMSRCYIWEHLSPLMYKSHKAQELPVTYYNRTTERSQERQKRGEGRHVVNGSGADLNPRSDTGHLMQLWKEWVRKNRLLYECLVFALHVFVISWSQSRNSVFYWSHWNFPPLLPLIVSLYFCTVSKKVNYSPIIQQGKPQNMDQLLSKFHPVYLPYIIYSVKMLTNTAIKIPVN